MKKNNVKWWGLLGISLASFLGCIDFTIVNTALPSIQTGLSATVTQLQWIINIFLLALAALMVIKGRIADLYGRRRVLYIGMIIFALSSLGAGLSPNIYWLILFRFVQGVGVAILYTVPVAIISSLFPIEERARATGLIFGVNGFGLAIGPVVGGFIISALSWRWIFLVNPPIIIFSFIICLYTLPESKSHEHGNKIDWWGFLLLAVSMPILVLTTVQGTNWGWDSPLVLGLYAVALICLAFFYFVERRSESPILQLNLFANRVFISASLANFLLSFYYTIAFFILPLYLHDILRKSSYEIGLLLLPATAMVALLSPLVGHTIEKFGVKINLTFGFILFGVSAFCQTYFNADTHIGFIIFSLLFLGIGWAFILSPSFVAAIASLPESMSGVATGSVGTLHNFGGAIGLALGTLLYHYQAKSLLLLDAAKLKLLPGAWVEQAIANPDDAIHVISQATQLSPIHARELVTNFFTYSYSSLMWLLLIISALGITVVIMGLKKQET